MEPLVRVENLYGGYGEESLLKDVSFNIERGEILGVIGPNGSGKSTLFKHLTRVLTPQRGRILFENRDISAISLKDLCKKSAMVKQETLIAFPFTVEEVVLMGRTPHLSRMQFISHKDREIAERSLEWMEALHLKDKQIDQLSGGERQRVMIAKALAQEPILLLLDEPTSHLDIGHQAHTLDLLKRLNRENKLTIAMILHDLNLAGEYCDRLLFLNEGAVFKQGPASEVLNYENIEAAYKTVVIVAPNPISKRPHIFLVSKEILCAPTSS